MRTCFGFGGSSLAFKIVSELLRKGCKASHNQVTTYLSRPPLSMMGFCIGYVSGLKHAIDATTFLPFTWTTPRDSSVSALGVCVCVSHSGPPVLQERKAGGLAQVLESKR